ncbi:transcriptional regulator, partial [Staphylococcus aureus]|nr:transcriptional regulator [Staphylococcus aureus]
SEVLNSTFGCDPLEIVQTISRNHCAYPNHAPTSDIYWNNIETRNGYILQSNKVSNIYRVLNPDNQPIFGTSKMREAETYFNRNAKEELVHI